MWWPIGTWCLEYISLPGQRFASSGNFNIELSWRQSNGISTPSESYLKCQEALLENVLCLKILCHGPCSMSKAITHLCTCGWIIAWQHIVFNAKVFPKNTEVKALLLEAQQCKPVTPQSKPSWSCSAPLYSVAQLDSMLILADAFEALQKANPTRRRGTE